MPGDTTLTHGEHEALLRRPVTWRSLLAVLGAFAMVLVGWNVWQETWLRDLDRNMVESGTHAQRLQRIEHFFDDMLKSALQPAGVAKGAP